MTKTMILQNQARKIKTIRKAVVEGLLNQEARIVKINKRVNTRVLALVQITMIAAVVQSKDI